MDGYKATPYSSTYSVITFKLFSGSISENYRSINGKCSASKFTCETLSSFASSIVASSSTSIFVISLAIALDSNWSSFVVSTTQLQSCLQSEIVLRLVGRKMLPERYFPDSQTSLSRSFSSSHKLISYAKVNTTSLFSPASFASSSILLFTSLRTSVDTISAVASTPVGKNTFNGTNVDGHTIYHFNRGFKRRMLACLRHHHVNALLLRPRRTLRTTPSGSRPRCR